MRSSARRSFKYSKKITARVIPGQAAGYAASLPIRRRIEACVKTAGITPMLQIPYIAFLEELVKRSAVDHANEPAIIYNKWLMKGLDGPTLIALGQCAGIGVAAPPPPPPCEYSCDPNTLALYHCDTGAGVLLIDSCAALNMDFKGPGEPVWTVDYKCPTHAIHFDGINDYVTQATFLDVYPSNGTIEFWFKLDAEMNPTNPGTRSLFEKLNVWGTKDFIYAYFTGGGDAGKIAFDVRRANVGHIALTTTNTWLAGVWYHVAFTWGAAGVKIWVGAVNEGSHAFTGVPQNGAQCPFVIGGAVSSTCLLSLVSPAMIFDEIRFSNVQRTTFIL